MRLNPAQIKEMFSGRHVALIDMDGVLYDSMKYHTKAWNRLATELGIPSTEEEFYLYEGMTGAATLQLLWKHAGREPLSAERIRELYSLKTRYFHASGDREPMAGADRMIRALMDAGWQRVLVTGSGQRSLLDLLDRDYPGAFLPEMRVTGLDVVNGKPDPEPYLKGMALAGANPSECIVIENAPLGVRAGKRAGCYTIAVTTGPIPREEFEKEGADIIFPSMEVFADALPDILTQASPLSKELKD